MSVLLPVVPVPDAPMEVPLPVAPVLLPLVPMEPEPLAVLLLVVSLGEVVVDGAVLEVEELAPASVSFFLPQAVRDRAAIRASAAHCAIGDLIIRNSLVWFEVLREKGTALHAACGSL
jgi:hypothetical protein